MSTCWFAWQISFFFLHTYLEKKKGFFFKASKSDFEWFVAKLSNAFPLSVLNSVRSRRPHVLDWYFLVKSLLQTDNLRRNLTWENGNQNRPFKEGNLEMLRPSTWIFLCWTLELSVWKGFGLRIWYPFFYSQVFPVFRSAGGGGWGQESGGRYC